MVAESELFSSVKYSFRFELCHRKLVTSFLRFLFSICLRRLSVCGPISMLCRSLGCVEHIQSEINLRQEGGMWSTCLPIHIQYRQTDTHTCRIHGWLTYRKMFRTFGRFRRWVWLNETNQSTNWLPSSSDYRQKIDNEHHKHVIHFSFWSLSTQTFGMWYF